MGSGLIFTVFEADDDKKAAAKAYYFFMSFFDCFYTVLLNYTPTPVKLLQASSHSRQASAQKF